MKHQVTATSDLGDEYPITTPADLRNLLADLARSERAQYPMVILAVDDAEMMIGLRRDRGVLYWLAYNATDDSVRDAVAIRGTNERPIVYGASEVLMPAFTELPINTIITAAEQFARTGQRPTSVTWVDYDDAMQASRHRAAS